MPSSPKTAQKIKAIGHGQSSHCLIHCTDSSEKLTILSSAQSGTCKSASKYQHNKILNAAVKRDTSEIST